MGWGISIDVDDNGHVFCSDADWETYSQDYEEDDTVYPPSSREFLRDYMDSHHHGEIDMARDEGSAELAHEECVSAFLDAKYAYDGLTDLERTDMHMEWLAKTREELSKIVVDEEATANARTRIEELNYQIDKLKMELYENQRIVRPSQRKASLEQQLAQEIDSWE
jgi:hypothetical protein